MRLHLVEYIHVIPNSILINIFYTQLRLCIVGTGTMPVGPSHCIASKLQHPICADIIINCSPVVARSITINVADRVLLSVSD